MIFGMLEMGWMVMKQSEITNAARAGARYAAMPSVMKDSQVTTDLMSPALQVLQRNRLLGIAEVKVPSGVNQPVGSLVTVEVSVPYRGSELELMPKMLWTFAPSKLTASVSMAKEGPSS